MFTIEEIIVESHDDFEIWASVAAGFDTLDNFVVGMEYNNYDERKYDKILYAIVDKDEAGAMAKHLNVEARNLPKVFSKRFGNRSDIMVPSEVEDIFKQILDFIIDCDAHYTLKENEDRK